jgi:POT family proton-dependent oligopeptide transporter
MVKVNLLKADVKQSKNSEKEIVFEEISSKESTQRIIALGILFTIVIFFWMAFYQNGFALTLFAERSTVIYDFLRPETYQFFNPFFILLLTPLLLSFFSKLNKKGKEPKYSS